MANPPKKKFQHLIGKKVSVKVKLPSKRDMNIPGILNDERVVYGRNEVGLKVDGQDEIQWFNAAKLITP